MNEVKELREEPKIELRRLTAADAEAFFELIKSNTGPLEKSEGTGENVDVTPELVQNLFNEDPETVRMGIFKEGKLVGHINLMPETEDTAAISYLVDKDSARSGIATAAMGQFLQTVAPKYRVLNAYVKPTNTESLGFLEKMKFEPAGETPNNNVVYRYQIPQRQG